MAVTTITSRAALTEYCLRRLGKPVIEINLDEQQMNDRIDEAIEYFRQFHYDGSQKVFKKLPAITQANIDSRSIDVGDPVESVIRVMTRSGLYSSSFSNQKYQMFLSDMDTFMASDLTNYHMKMSHINLMEEMFENEYTFMFNKVQNKLFIETNWKDEFTVGEILVIECYEILDPDTHTEIYDDHFLKRYVTALFKKQWGNNLKKFEGVQLPGGITLNGQQIYNEALEELNKIEEEMNLNWELPPDGLVG